ncbi:hypothetical protein D3C81_1867570 [compost metagenome]
MRTSLSNGSLVWNSRPQIAMIGLTDTWIPGIALSSWASLAVTSGSRSTLLDSRAALAEAASGMIMKRTVSTSACFLPVKPSGPASSRAL